MNNLELKKQEQLKEVTEILKDKFGISSIFNIKREQFQTLPLFVEGESKEIRVLDKDNKYCIIYFKPTVYSFTANRTGIVEGSNIPRVRVSDVIVKELIKHGIDHSYISCGDQYVISELIPNAPNIEVICKNFHTGTSKHRYYRMNGSTVRKSHPYFGGFKIKDMESYPCPIIRFDWRNPFFNPEDHHMMADEVLCEEQADWYIDTKKARKTAAKTFSIVSDFLDTKDIVCYDLCLFITEEGDKVFGEISPDCGRFRHFSLGSLDKDVWRSGGSSEKVLEKWNLLYKLITK